MSLLWTGRQENGRPRAAWFRVHVRLALAPGATTLHDAGPKTRGTFILGSRPLGSQQGASCGELRPPPLPFTRRGPWAHSTHTHTRTHTHAHTQAHTHVCTHAHTCTHPCVCAPARTHPCTHAHTHPCARAHAHTQTRTCTHAHTDAHMCARMHTHAHTDARTHMCGTGPEPRHG